MTAQSVVLTATDVGHVSLQSTTRHDAALGAGEVAGRTLMSLISPGTELSIIAGHLAPLPFALGYASVFQVEQVGNAVADVAIGDRVLSMGHHATHQRCDANVVAKLPADLPLEAAGFARLMIVSMTTLATTPARPPAQVMVTGLGLVGNMAAQIFQSCGYDVLAVDPDQRRRGMTRGVGIGRAVSAVPVDDKTIARQIALQVECSGHEAASLDGAKVIQPGGEISLVGCPWFRRSDRHAHELLHEIFHHYVTVRSGWEWQLPRQPGEFASHNIWSHMRQALQWLNDGRIRTEGLAQIIAPSEAQQAYNCLHDHTAESLTYLIDWR